MHHPTKTTVVTALAIGTLGGWLGASLLLSTAFAQERNAGPVSTNSTQLPKPFVFAEYLTFARVVPFEQPSLAADSLGNILTAQGHGEAGYMYHEAAGTPLLAVAIPAGMVICTGMSPSTRRR